MHARDVLLGGDVLFERDGDGRKDDTRIALIDEVLSTLQDWALECRRAVRSQEPSPQFGLGEAIFVWLDESCWASRWAAEPSQTRAATRDTPLRGSRIVRAELQVSALQVDGVH